MDKPSYLFILNPNSGTSIGKKAEIIEQTIYSFAEKSGNHAVVLYTKERGHATTIVRENLAKASWKAIVAVGGDGTVNEIARALINSETPVGILPLGSGNGLARHLGLTTVRVRIAELGERALVRLVSSFGKRNAGSDELHAPELVIRSSTDPKAVF